MKKRPPPCRGGRFSLVSAISLPYPQRAADAQDGGRLDAVQAQIFLTVVPYFTARCPSVSPERILW